MLRTSGAIEALAAAGRNLAARRDEFLQKLGRRALVMGILNVTPDSFSDGGRYDDETAAVMQARAMAQAGADIIDVGAESTRPGASPVSGEDEWRRLETVLPRLLAEIDAPLSIDTYKAETARRAVALGVCLVNDVWGLQKDERMAAVIAKSGAALVVMHNRESVDPTIDIVEDMRRFFDISLARAEKAGVMRERILLDPGVGFGKTMRQNFQCLAATADLVAAYGLPVLIGVSRKRLFADLLGAPLEDRLIPTIVANLGALARGAAVFRVHDVAEHVAAFKVFEAFERD